MHRKHLIALAASICALAFPASALATTTSNGGEGGIAVGGVNAANVNLPIVIAGNGIANSNNGNGNGQHNNASASANGGNGASAPVGECSKPSRRMDCVSRRVMSLD